MSITVALPPTLRPFRGFDNPAFPAGYWAIFASVLGDVSLGLMQVSIHFQEAGDPRPSLIYSLEEMMIFTTIGGAQSVRMNVFNMDDLPTGESTGSISTNYRFRLEDLGVLALGAALSDENSRLPIFLGSPIKNANNATAVFAIDNIDAASLAVKAQGYYWGPAAINAMGGPQRPDTGLYRG